jgi:hypothetical protein
MNYCRHLERCNIPAYQITVGLLIDVIRVKDVYENCIMNINAIEVSTNNALICPSSNHIASKQRLLNSGGGFENKLARTISDQQEARRVRYWTNVFNG